MLNFTDDVEQGMRDFIIKIFLFLTKLILK